MNWQATRRTHMASVCRINYLEREPAAPHIGMPFAITKASKKNSGWGAAMKNFFMNLISATHGSGPSSTRLIYLVNGLASVFSAIVMTIGGIEVYCVHQTANAAYWGGAAALWTASLGFGSLAKNHQQTVAKEREQAPRFARMEPAMQGY